MRWPPSTLHLVICMYKAFFYSLLREPFASPGGLAYSRPEQEPG